MLYSQKQYELTNHLGNVLATVTARPILTHYEQVFTGVQPEVTTISDYYPFGMLIPDRHWESEGYRWGFNGKEKDDEVKASGNSYDFGARLYDARLGRWQAVDPLAKQYISESPFSGFNNNPIIYDDPNGKGGRIKIRGNEIEISGKIYVYSDGNVTDAQIKEAFGMHQQEVITFSKLHDLTYQNQGYQISLNVEIILVTPDKAKAIFEENNAKKIPDSSINFFVIQESALNNGAIGRGGTHGEPNSNTNLNIGALTLDGLNTGSISGLVFEEFWHTATGGFYPMAENGDVNHNYKNAKQSICDGIRSEGESYTDENNKKETSANKVTRHDLFVFMKAAKHPDEGIIFRNWEGVAGNISKEMFTDKSNEINTVK